VSGEEKMINFGKKYCSFILTMVVGLLMLSSASQAETLIRFQASDLKHDVCKYTYHQEHRLRRGLPPLFDNVKGIYIQVKGSVDYEPKFREISFLKDDALALVAGCTIQKQLGKSSPPIFLHAPRERWPDRIHGSPFDGDLNIAISLHLRDGNLHYKNLFPGTLLLLKVEYSRNDVTEYEEYRFCAEPFPYTEDQTTFHKLLTRAMHFCLDAPYWN
jgi:hypothetical protein